MNALARLTAAAVISSLAVMPILSVEAEPLGRVSIQDTFVTARFQTEVEGARAFVSGPWRVTVVDAVQSPAIEGISTNASSGTEWVVVVADIANQSNEPAGFSLADLTLGRGDSSNQPAHAVAVSDVNLRAGSSTDTAILAAVLEGSAVTVLGEPENGFYPVAFADQQGWIFGDFLSLGDSPGTVGAAPAVDPAASQAVADALNLDVSLDGEIAPGGVERGVAAFPVAAGSQEFSLALGEAAVPLELAQRAALNPADLPPLTDAPSMNEAEFLTVTGGRSLEVQDTSGAVTEIQLLGIDTPTGNECFSDEAEAELLNLVGNGIALEQVGDEYLLWGNVDSAATPSLVNHALVERGFAAASEAGEASTFQSWLTAAEEAARAEGRGLWAECTGVHGTQRPQPTPTPTPTPSPAELRADYTMLPDIRELAIRPGNLIGDQIAFTGEIFTIQVAAPGNAFFLGLDESVVTAAAMQIWVTAPDGTREAVYVGYDGDTTGMFEGTWVTVYGTVEGVQTGTNAFGGEIAQPLVKADIIDFA